MASLDDVRQKKLSKSDLISSLQKQGYDEDQIESTLAMMESAGADKDAAGFDVWSDNKNSQANKPNKPDFFKKEDDIKPFTPVFILQSSTNFVLGGIEIKAKKLNLNDIMRLVAKLPHQMNYLGYGLPDNMIDPLTGRYKILETAMMLFQRALGDYDFVKQTPTDFSYSVLEEIAHLFNVQVDFLLSCDPDEVMIGIKKVVETNQGFFIRLWNDSGPIKETISLIGGMISAYTKPIKEELKRMEVKQEPKPNEP